MPTIQLQAQLSAEDLLRAVGQLEAGELERFVTEVLSLRAQRWAPALSATETELLQQINQGLPESLMVRYQELIVKRQTETLSSEEHAELLRLTDEVELGEAKRAQALIELARLRQVPLARLLNDLQIPPPSDD